MSDKLFSKYELYDLVNAQDSALVMEEETGIGIFLCCFLILHTGINIHDL